MRKIKIPLQDFALKMQGGGGDICGTLRYIHLLQHLSSMRVAGYIQSAP